jgi:hypothetical protein
MLGELFEFNARKTTVNWKRDRKTGSNGWPAEKNEYQEYGTEKERKLQKMGEA